MWQLALVRGIYFRSLGVLIALQEKIHVPHSVSVHTAHATEGCWLGPMTVSCNFLEQKKHPLWHGLRQFFCFVSFKLLFRDQVFFYLKSLFFIFKEQQTILDCVFPVTFLHQITTTARNFPVIGTFPTDEFFRRL